MNLFFRMIVRAASLVALAAAIPGTCPADEFALELPRKIPCNLFEHTRPVVFTAVVKAKKSEALQASATITDYFGRPVARWADRWQVTAGEPRELEVPLGKFPHGYYELTLNVIAPDGKRNRATASFGAVRFIHMSAAEFRERDRRFGLKIWQLGAPGVWWRRPLVWDVDEVVEATASLGLQWTRHVFNQPPRDEPGIIATERLIREYPMNVVLKVERFPREFYDAARYGPMEEFEKKYGKGKWKLRTLPKKTPYQRWLKQEIAKIPTSQNVFEVWNEPWNEMAPDDFATLCNWVTDAILDVRPDAVIGPNLIGSTSEYQFDAKVIAAGGLKNMKMVALHPYGGAEDRSSTRGYRRWLREKTGRDIDLYVTEFGSHSTPKGPDRRTERTQAQRTVRQALCLYAEDIKALIPHTMGQREHNKLYREHWFGFFRLNRQPKPVLVAYANCARLVDGSRFVGDLWYGPGMEAMLFERNGTFTQILFTRGDEKTVKIDTGRDRVTVVGTAGAERTLATDNGRLHATIGPDPLYVLDVSPELETQANTELNPERWPEPAEKPRPARTAKKMEQPPTFDGRFDEWGDPAIALENDKVVGSDGSGKAYIAWDTQNFYIGIDARDDDVINESPRAKLYRQDSLEVWISTEPRTENPGYGPNDHQFFITPHSAEDRPIAAEVVDPNAGVVVDLENAAFHATTTRHGWAAEVAIPWQILDNFDPDAGKRLALQMRMNDADSSHERFKIDPVDNPHVSWQDPTRWPYLILTNAD